MWLQVDAQSGWPGVVAAANQQFESDHPGTTVNVQYQSWTDHLQKFDATLAGGGGPDVIEMGNTEMTKYMAAGAFAPLTKSSFDNSASLAQGPRRIGRVRWEDVRRARTTRARASSPTAPTCSRRPGSAKLPGTTAEYVADAKKLLAKNPEKGFSPVYIAGEDWYVGMAFVFDYGGGIAQQVSGQWKGLLTSPKSLAGLAAFKNFYLATSRAPKTNDGTKPNPYDVYAQGQAASMVGPSWFSCCVGKAYTPTTAQFVMPGHVKGQAMPGFLGGSDLAVTVTSGNKSLAADWIKDFAGHELPRKQFQAKGNIPNATNLLGGSVNERAAARSWFEAPKRAGVDVENGNVLKTCWRRS